MMHRPKGAKGRFNADYKARDFWKFYYKNLQGEDAKLRVSREEGPRVLRDLMEGFMDTIIDGGYMTLPFIGSFNVTLVHFTDENNFKYFPPDWPKTWAYWEELYKDIPKEERKKIKNKPILRHHNDHTDMRVGRIDIYKNLGLKNRKWKFLPAEKHKEAVSKAIFNKSNTRAYIYRDFRT